MARPHDIPAAEIAERLAERIGDVVAALYPSAVVRGPIAYLSWKSKDDTGSFHVRLRAAGRHAQGSWNRYSERIGGDALNLVAYALTGRHTGKDEYRRALEWARDFLGLAGGRPETEAEKAERRRRRQAEEERQARAEWEDAERAAEHARAILAASVPLTYDPPDLVVTYLTKNKKRRLDPAGLAALNPRAIRFAPGLRYWGGRDWTGPAMVACLVDPAVGVRAAVHCTFLRPDGLEKAPFGKGARLMRGECRGAVVPLSLGLSGLTLKAAAEAGCVDDVILAEGVETGLALALAIPEARVWACLNLGFIGAAPVDHPAIGRVIVALENDIKRQAVETRERVLEELTAHGKPLGLMTPPSGSDFGDTYAAGD